MKISVFGLGYVGCVSLGCLAKIGHELVGVDTNKSKVNQINNGQATIVEKEIDLIIKEEHEKGKIRATKDINTAIKETDVSILCVGTPTSSNGHLNFEHLFDVADGIGYALKHKNTLHYISIRSTISPGTTRKISNRIEEVSGKRENVDFFVLSNPEFLREGSAVSDFFNPPFILIGSENVNAAEKYAEIFSGIQAEIVISKIEVAEIMKYVNNSFHALKISFANEIGNICKELNINSNEVMDIFVKDKILNISSYYLKPGFAYGGSCLPKDLKGLVTLAHDLYLDTPLLGIIEKSNHNQITRAIKMIESFGKKNIGFLGISFKAGTDDLRNSPTVHVLETLLGKGYSISIYDTNINVANLTGTNKDYIDSKIPHLSRLLKHEINEVIESSEIVILSNDEKEYLTPIKNLSDKLVIDFVYIKEKLNISVQYCGLNWSNE